MTLAPNPNPARITAAQWWFTEQLLALEPGTQNAGIYVRKSGYHGSRADNQLSWPGNYSIVDKVDLGGPDDKGAAFDWTFPEAHGRDFRRITYRTNLILASYRDPDDPRLNGWREFYGCVNGVVKGCDTRYWRDATSDRSHEFHIHGSEDRDKVESFENKKALLSVLRAETVSQWLSPQKQGDDMSKTILVRRKGTKEIWLANTMTRRLIDPKDLDDVKWVGSPAGQLKNLVSQEIHDVANLDAFGVAVQPTVGLSPADRAAIVADLESAVLAKLSAGVTVKLEKR